MFLFITASSGATIAQIRCSTAMKSMRRTISKLTLLCALSVMLPFTAQAQNQTALETAEEGVNTLLAAILESKPYFLSDRDRYFDAIESVLNSFVDFEAVAKVVMSRYGDAATDAQTQRFAEILKTTLTRFYGASLASYDGGEITFIPPENPDQANEDQVVGIELKNGDAVIPLRFQMFQNDNQEWKLKNLSLGGINLGRQYFTQFSALMGQNNNDIDKVLDGWK